MPTKRILLTLFDVKQLISKKYKSENISFFEDKTLKLEDFYLGDYEVEEDSYLFQVDGND